MGLLAKRHGTASLTAVKTRAVTTALPQAPGALSRHDPDAGTVFQKVARSHRVKPRPARGLLPPRGGAEPRPGEAPGFVRCHTYSPVPFAGKGTGECLVRVVSPGPHS